MGRGDFDPHDIRRLPRYPPAMAGKIFVNYRREDGAASAARLRDRLAQAFGTAKVFMDVDNLLAGQRFDRELDKALAETDVFLAVLGPRWSDILAERATRPERDYVREEIASALAKGVVVIPVLVERASLPRGDALPEDLRALVLHQKHDLTHERFGRDAEELITAIRFARKSQAKPLIPAALKVPWRWVSATALGVLAAAWFAAYQAGMPVGVLSPSADELASAAARQRASDPAAVDAKRRDDERAAIKADMDAKIAAAGAKLDADASQAWAAVKDTTRVADLDTFIDQYGDSAFVALAKSRLADLKAADAAKQPASPARRISFGPVSELVLLNNGTWVEYQAGAPVWTFRPATDSGTELVVFDPTRDSYLRLVFAEKQTYFRTGPTAPWAKLAPITKMVDERSSDGNKPARERPEKARERQSKPDRPQQEPRPRPEREPAPSRGGGGGGGVPNMNF